MLVEPIHECPICKGTSITNIGGIKDAYGLVKLNSDGTIDEKPHYFPVVPMICNKCGHIEFRHVPLDKLKKN